MPTVYKHDPDRDEIRETVVSLSPAPDTKGGKRTDRMSAVDEGNLVETKILTVEELEKELGQVPDRTAKIEALKLTVKQDGNLLEQRLQKRDAAAERLRQLEHHAWGGPRRRFPVEYALVPVLALGEAALAYIGLKVAAPPLGDAGNDQLLKLIANHGAEALAVAVGLGAAVLQILVGRELALASRGVFTDPTRVRGGEE